jgi:hypothetical protein
MSEVWLLFQFGLVVRSFCDEASEDLWDEMERRMATLQEHGNACKMPVSEPLRDGFFALRANVDNSQGRLIYFFGPQRKQIVFVHSMLAKKQRRIPNEIIDESARRRTMILADMGLIRGFKIN